MRGFLFGAESALDVAYLYALPAAAILPCEAEASALPLLV